MTTNVAESVKRCQIHKRYQGIRKPTGKCKKCWEIYQDKHQILTEIIDADMTVIKATAEVRDLRQKYQAALENNRQLQEQVLEVLALKQYASTFTISSKQRQESEATAVIVASDWHFEEEVKPNTVNDVNSFDLTIAKTRAEHFFQNALTLIKLCQQNVNIDNVVLALLGDFISNHIHEELMETNQLLPIDAAEKVHDILTAGIKFLLKHTNCQFIIPCHSGNHGRITAKTRHGTEAGNSLEHAMYHSLARDFAKDKRVKFMVASGYHTYITIFGKTLRFHHGHGIRYHGGVGGIYVPLNKAIAQWNKIKHADLDVLAHWHQFRDGGNFICNGSLIGYNAYALSIKADYEKPQQAFFLIDKKRGKTIVAPILLDSN